MSVSFVEMSEVLESIFDAFVEISVHWTRCSTDLQRCPYHSTDVRIYIRCICRNICIIRRDVRLICSDVRIIRRDVCDLVEHVVVIGRDVRLICSDVRIIR